jgi:hypothetical protein
MSDTADDKSAELEPSISTITDKWTLNDTLGHSAYAYAIAKYITHRDTKPPVYIYIKGTHGVGKTSLMRMIQMKIDRGSFRPETENVLNRMPTTINEILEIMNKDSEQELRIIPLESDQNASLARLTIWYDAWKNESSGHIWSGLLDSIIVQIADHMDPKSRDMLFLELRSRRYGKNKVRDEIYDRISEYSRKKALKWSWTLPIVLFGAAAIMTIVSGMYSGAHNNLHADRLKTTVEGC